MSGKWRRKRKRSKWFRIFKKSDKDSESGTTVFKTFRIRNSKVRKQVYYYKHHLSRRNRKTEWKEPEPLTDVFEDEDEIVVVAECVGFNEKNLKINVKDRRLVLSAESKNRQYHKSLNLPKKVIPHTLSTTYKNGVLEIRLKKVVEEKPLTK